MHLNKITLMLLLSVTLSGCGSESTQDEPPIELPPIELPPIELPPSGDVYIIGEEDVIASTQISRNRWDEGIDLSNVTTLLLDVDVDVDVDGESRVLITNNTPRTLKNPYLVYHNGEVTNYVNVRTTIEPFTRVYLNSPESYKGFNVYFHEDSPFFKVNITAFSQYAIDQEMERYHMYGFEQDVVGYKFWGNSFNYNKYFIEFMNDELEGANIIIPEDYVKDYVVPGYHTTVPGAQNAPSNLGLSDRILANDDSSFSIKMANLLLHKPNARYQLSEREGTNGTATIGDGWLMVWDHTLPVMRLSPNPSSTFLHEKLHNHGFGHEGNMTYGWADQVGGFFQDKLETNFYDSTNYRVGLPTRADQFTNKNGEAVLLVRWGHTEAERSEPFIIDSFIVGTTLGDKITNLEVGVYQPDGTFTPFQNSRTYDNGAVVLSENEASLLSLDLKNFNLNRHNHAALYVKLTKEQAELNPNIYINAGSSTASDPSLFGNGVFNFEHPLISRCEDGLPSQSEPSDYFSTGSCIKVIEFESMAFSGSPSEAALNYLGYHRSSGGTPKSYNDYRTSEELLETSFGIFDQRSNHEFDNDFAHMQDILGQFSYYCQDLADMEFDGKNNWRRPTDSELESLSGFVDENSYKGVLGQQGWSVVRPYLSQSAKSNEQNYARWLDGSFKQDSVNFTDAKFASCISQDGEIPFQLKIKRLGDNVLELTAEDNNGKTINSQSLEWYSLDKRIATVDSQGKVEFISEGSTHIVAKNDVQHAVFDMSAGYNNLIIDSNNVEIEGEETIKAGESSFLDATYGDDGTVNPLWESLTPHRMIVSNTGEVTVPLYGGEYFLDGFISAEFDGKETIKKLNVEINPLNEFNIGDKTIINVPEELLDPDKSGWDMTSFCEELYEVPIATTEEYQTIYDYLAKGNQLSRLQRNQYMTSDSQHSYQRNIVEFKLDSFTVHSRSADTTIGQTHGVMCVK
ncbi:hypothetical protein [uncultured Vibrio sp.]|uniref:hypothetical protein n=1 Tax=uncultured Vibrio sp. TaxID=114054 RepID=UPI0026204D5B|nr:hypothetical protein [uncultured Vibrio sp.]